MPATRRRTTRRAKKVRRATHVRITKRRRTASSARSTKSRRPKKLIVPLPRAREGRRLPPGICRLDYPRVRGYIVRLSYRRTRAGWKPRFKAYFGDTRHGGKAKAFAAAQAWLRAVTETGKAPAV
jgi:hypothetical protein